MCWALGATIRNKIKQGPCLFLGKRGNRGFLFNQFFLHSFTPSPPILPLLRRLFMGPAEINICSLRSFLGESLLVPWHVLFKTLHTFISKLINVGDLGSILGLDLWVGKIPWRRERLPTPAFWPGEFYRLYNPCGRRVGYDGTTFTYYICEIYIHICVCVYIYIFICTKWQRKEGRGPTRWMEKNFLLSNWVPTL